MSLLKIKTKLNRMKICCCWWCSWSAAWWHESGGT